jgi:hypothetical protein
MGLDESAFDSKWTDEDVREWQRTIAVRKTAQGVGTEPRAIQRAEIGRG